MLNYLLSRQYDIQSVSRFDALLITFLGFIFNSVGTESSIPDRIADNFEYVGTLTFTLIVLSANVLFVKNYIYRIVLRYDVPKHFSKLLVVALGALIVNESVILAYDISYGVFTAQWTLLDGIAYDIPHLSGAIIFLYVGYYRQYARAYTTPGQPESHEEHMITAYKGSTVHRLPEVDVTFLLLDHGVVRAYTRSGVTYQAKEALRFYENQLDPQRFFRLNRQVIVSRSAIEGYTPTADRKLAITLVGLPQEVYVSRERATRFKTWLNE